MIYRCENCKNRHNCCENKEQYERTCNTIGDIARAIDKTPKYHCWYSLTIRCDYWVEDRETLEYVCQPTEKGDLTAAKAIKNLHDTLDKEASGMGEKEKRKRANMRLKYIAMMIKWLDSEPPMVLFWRWRKWKKSRPWRYEE